MRERKPAMIKDVLKNAYKAKEAWLVFAVESPEKAQKFLKFFHLRPASGYITIISTHDDYPMRGVAIAPTKLKDALRICADAIITDSNIDWAAIADAFDRKKEFKEGHRGSEFPMQAKMINCMNGGDAELADAVGGKLHFIASEVILHEGRSGERKRIDVVAYDGAGRIFLFELKSADSNDNPIPQLKEYLSKYGKGGEKNLEFERLLSAYPICSAVDIKEYVGFVVTGKKSMDKNKQFEKSKPKDEIGKIHMLD
jgi:hypothetical protein